MIRRTLSILFLLASLATTVPAVWYLRGYFVDPAFNSDWKSIYAEDSWAGVILMVAAVQAVLWLIGYLLTLSSRSRRRPWELFVPAAAGPGFTAGAALCVFTSLGYDSMALVWGGAGAAVAALAVVAGEFTLRWASQAVVRNLDRKNMGGAALTAGRLALLWKPGEQALLRSVMLERFRRGNRGELAARLRDLYEAGDREPDLLEVLCQIANEEKKPAEFLQYLRDLLKQHPEDEELQDALLSELMEQGLEKEALAHIEEHGAADSPQGVEAFADLLVKAGRLDDAVKASERLAELEGIPLRRSDAILRRVLSADESNIPAVNALAEQASRLARKDQVVRWLLRSFELDPSQGDVREHLVELLEEQGQTQPLENVLRQAAEERPRDAAVVLHYTSVLHTNGKDAEALERLQSLEEHAPDDARLKAQKAVVLFELGRHDEARPCAEAVVKLTDAEDLRAEMKDVLRRIEEAQLTAELAERVSRAREEPDNVDLQLDVLTRLMDRHVDRSVVHADELVRRVPSTRDEVKKLVARHMAGREKGGYPLLNFLADLQVADSEYDEALETVLEMARRSMDTFSALREGTQKILRRSPHHLRTLRTMGEMYHDLGQFTEMIHAYSLYIANGGEGTDLINKAMANAYLSLGDYDSARRFVGALVERPKVGSDEAIEALAAENREYLLRLVPLGVEKGRAEDAAEMMKKLELLSPDQKQVGQLRKEVDEALGEQRLAFLKRELEAGKGDRNTLEELGDLSRQAEDFNHAITYYQRAARQSGASRVPMAKLAYSFARKRLFDTASETLGELKLSLQDDPEELEQLMVWIYRTGEVFEEARFFDRALRIFKQLMKVDAGYQDVLERVERLSAK